MNGDRDEEEAKIRRKRGGKRGRRSERNRKVGRVKGMKYAGGTKWKYERRNNRERNYIRRQREREFARRRGSYKENWKRRLKHYIGIFK
jgi:hypothetical protein